MSDAISFCGVDMTLEEAQGVTAWMSQPEWRIFERILDETRKGAYRRAFRLKPPIEDLGGGVKAILPHGYHRDQREQAAGRVVALDGVLDLRAEAKEDLDTIEAMTKVPRNNAR